MSKLDDVLVFIRTNPQIIALGQAAVQEVISLITAAVNLHKVGVLTDAQVAAILAAVTDDVAGADAAWDAALAAHKQGAGA